MYQDICLVISHLRHSNLTTSLKALLKKVVKTEPQVKKLFEVKLQFDLRLM